MLEVDIEQDQFLHREAVGMGGHALNQLRGVGAGAANHDDLHAHVEGCYPKG